MSYAKTVIVKNTTRMFDVSQFNLGAALQDYKENQELLVLPAGTHMVEITTAKSKSSKNGNPTIVFFGKVVEGPYAGKRVGLGTITYTENGSFYFFRTLKGFGVTDDFIQQANSLADPMKAIADSLVGRVANVTVSVDTYNGEERNRIEGVAVVGGVSSTQQLPAPVAAAPAEVQIPQQQSLPPQAAVAQQAATAVPGRAPSF